MNVIVMLFVLVIYLLLLFFQLNKNHYHISLNEYLKYLPQLLFYLIQLFLLLSIVAYSLMNLIKLANNELLIANAIISILVIISVPVIITSHFFVNKGGYEFKSCLRDIIKSIFLVDLIKRKNTNKEIK